VREVSTTGTGGVETRPLKWKRGSRRDEEHLRLTGLFTDKISTNSTLGGYSRGKHQVNRLRKGTSLLEIVLGDDNLCDDPFDGLPTLGSPDRRGNTLHQGLLLGLISRQDVSGEEVHSGGRIEGIVVVMV
jgi:hypothetical protein